MPVVVAFFGWVYVTGKHNKVLDNLAASGDLKGDSFLLHCVKQHLIKTSRLIVVLIGVVMVSAFILIGTK